MQDDLRNIILYGAGTQNLRMAYQPIVSAGYSVKAICDKDIKKQGKKFYDIEIISLKSLMALDKELDRYIIVVTIRSSYIVESVRKELEILNHAIVYTFEEFVRYAKLNCKVKRFSCIMTHLVDHCNLNCIRCSHFSPLDLERNFYLNPSKFQKECKRLSELIGKVDEFQLSGGETLLHPDAYIFPYIVRKYFPDAKIIMITNATLILSQKDNFLTSCRENGVQIWISKYPIGLDYERIVKFLNKENIEFEIGNSGNTDEQPKEMWGLPLKLDGNLNGRKNFECCLCMQYILRDGRLYPCANSAYIDLFNKYFGKNLPGPEINGVNIYEVNSIDELTREISKPVPLCQFCDSQHRMEGVAWQISKKDIREWSLP